MRNNEVIEKIKLDLSQPYIINNLLNNSEIDNLIDLFDSIEDHSDPLSGKINKNTGPTTLNLENYFDHSIVKKIISKIEQEIGPFDITASFFFKTDYPHIIHNDDTFELPDTVYKAITIPLKLYGDNIKDYPSLCFFDQFYFHGPSKFFKDEEFIPTYYNKQIYDYENIDGITEEKFDKTLYQKYFTHLKYNWLDGLTFQGQLPWVPGTAIIFDSVRLHCASDFRKLNIKEKLGISIFTKKII
jgi:hypothetical protein